MKSTYIVVVRVRVVRQEESLDEGSLSEIKFNDPINLMILNTYHQFQANQSKNLTPVV